MLPMTSTTTATFEVYSKKTELLSSKKIPAVTRVAACINEDTGVGPSIASGNQMCRPICADLPIAANKQNTQNTFKALTSCKSTCTFAVASMYVLAYAPTKVMSVVILNNVAIASNRKMSPILLITIAFMAALFACSREYQKLISKYEHIPIPSQPKKRTTKLAAHTRTIIKKVNNDK